MRRRFYCRKAVTTSNSASQMEQSSWLEEIRYSEDPSQCQDHPARDEEHNDVLQGESDGSQPSDHQADDTEA